MLLLYIALGGALGALARYGLAGWVQSRAGTLFPWGTLVVNVTGSFLIGLVLRYLEGTIAPPELRAMATIGLLGAFTTFSTFSYETVALLEDRELLRAALYSLGSVVLGLVAVLFGVHLAPVLLEMRG